jgi:hypothetical protein
MKTFLARSSRSLLLLLAVFTLADGATDALRVQRATRRKAGHAEERRAKRAYARYTLFIIRFVIHNAPLGALLRYLVASQ